MPELVQEYVSSRGAPIRLDRPAGVLRSVKLLGLQSRNGRKYLEAALQRAMSLYEGAKVNVNHPQGDPLSARDYRDRLGVIRGVEFKQGEGLFGNLHYNPKHALAEQLTWDAEHSPENVGLSHNVVARTSQEAGKMVVEEITRVQSVDLVADPATTSGLFEHDTSAASVEHTETDLSEKVRQLQEQVHQLEGELSTVRRRERVNALLDKHGLSATPDPDNVVTPTFLEELLAYPEQEQAERAIVDRAQTIRAAEARARESRPESSERSMVPEDPSRGSSETVDTFVRSITRH